MANVPRIPKLPKAHALPGKGGPVGAMQHTRHAPPDPRVRTDRDEVLAGIDQEGKLFHVWERGFAIGPDNARYSQETLLALEAEGTIVAFDSFGKAWVFQDFVDHHRCLPPDSENVDDAGVVGNALPTTLTWRRATDVE